ncbi:MAG: LacI family DNA-binding transcriptional regulator [Armatimonadota bacterium]
MQSKNLARTAVTLDDIAREVGVSKVTVSAVLNRRTSNVRVSDQTRQRIVVAAREMGYHPNALARGLTRRRTDTIALVMQSPNVFSGGSGFIAELMHGTVETANALGYDLMLHTKDWRDTDRDALALSDGRVDGVLLLRDKDDLLASRLEERGLPNVSIFSRPDSVDAWYVDADNLAGGRIAAQYLLALGHRRIGFIGGSDHSASASDRLQGFRQEIEEASVESFRFARVTYAGGDFSEVLHWFSKDIPVTERLTALFAWSDDVALRAISLLRDQYGLRVPEEVSVLGFDGTDAVGERSTPHLSSIRQPIYEIAAAGVQTLAARVSLLSMEGAVSPLSRQRLFVPTLLTRDSCAPFTG